MSKELRRDAVPDNLRPELQEEALSGTPPSVSASVSITFCSSPSFPKDLTYILPLILFVNVGLNGKLAYLRQLCPPEV